MEAKFKKLVDATENILLTGHVSPDPDAVSSVLLLGQTLRLNYPPKNIQMVLEEKPVRDLSFLPGYQEIEFSNLYARLREQTPDLLVILDANNYQRISRQDATKIKQLIKSKGTKTVIIDHHEVANRDAADLFINNHTPATVQEVYDLLFNQLGLEKPVGYAETTLLGIISDSFRFKYANPQHRQTFAIVSDLLDAGASIEELEAKTERYSLEQVRAFANMAAHIATEKDYTFSFLDDDFVEQWQADAHPAEALKAAAEIFTSQFTRNTEDKLWGFLVYAELAAGAGMYAVSLRSQAGVRDVSAIAAKLGGGGHKAAAGAKIAAKSVKEALDKVRTAIAEDELAPVK